jgi:hypothetical protein
MSGDFMNMFSSPKKLSVACTKPSCRISKEGGAEAVSHVKRLGHQENIAKEKTDDVLAKSPALKSKLYCESHRGYPYSCEVCGRAFSKDEGICYCGGSIKKSGVRRK